MLPPIPGEEPRPDLQASGGGHWRLWVAVTRRGEVWCADSLERAPSKGRRGVLLVI